MTTGATSLDDTQRALLLTRGDLGEVDDACLDDTRCALYGECSHDEDAGACYARDADCSKTAACALIGACQNVDYINDYSANGPGSCQPTEDAHCRASEICSTQGKCTAVSQWERFSCLARLDSDCAASLECETEGRCKALEGSCVTEALASTTCKERNDCASHGINCAPIDGRCRNPKGFDCSSSSACTNEDLCASTVEDVGGGPFVACHHSVAGCAAKPECAERGICGVKITSELGDGYFKGGCMLGGPTGCSSDYTRSWCVKTEAGCAASKRCASHGDCSAASPSEYCHPTEESHCDQSENCKEYDFCVLADESSYMVCSG